VKGFSSRNLKYIRRTKKNPGAKKKSPFGYETQRRVVDGSWKDNNGVQYHISSALVNHTESKHLAYAIASIEPFFQHLPIYDDDFGWTSYK
jgi:hypothetical protein